MRTVWWRTCGIVLAACLATLSGATPAVEPEAATAIGQSTWYWQNPLPRNYSISSVACLSITTCVAAGQDGSIVTTDDGATHWTQRTSGTNADLGITCPGQVICYALGALPAAGSAPPRNRQYVLLKSINGGKSWRQLYSFLATGPDQFLGDLVCASVTMCLVAGVATSPSTSILRTTDGGATWSTIDVAIPEGFGSVSCPTATVCYGLNGLNRTVVRSVNAGMTWQQSARVPAVGTEILEGFACVRANTCLVTSSYCCIEGMESDTFVSRDGAKTWNHLSHLANASLGPPICPSATTCYATAGYSAARTDDGGRTWVLRPLSDLPDEISCPGRTTCYVSAGVAVLKTRDGFGHVEETLAHNAIHHLFLDTVSCPTTTSCYAAEEGGLLRTDESGVEATTDGGKAWREKPKLPGQLISLACPTPTVCYAIYTPDSYGGGSSGVFRSGDAARTWRRLTLPMDTSPLDAITCVTATTCYATAVFNDTAHDAALLGVLATYDGGTTWTVHTGIDAAARGGATGPITSPVTPGHIACPSVTTCFVVATSLRFNVPSAGQSLETLTVLSTTDAGETWTRHTLAPAWAIGGNGAPPAFSCPTATTCYVVQYTYYSTPQGAPANVLVTHDAGATWHGTAVSAGTTLVDIACPGAQSCRVVGSTGVFTTDDGGATWQRPLLASGEQVPPMTSIACPAIDTCYVVGGVLILATHPPGSIQLTSKQFQPQGRRGSTPEQSGRQVL